MKRLLDHWGFYLSKDEVEEHLIAFCQASQEDKECMISETYGIFEGKLSGDVYTYYYHCGDSIPYNQYGKKDWWKGVDFRRVDYNFMTDEITITPIKKRTKQIVEMATENSCRML